MERPLFSEMLVDRRRQLGLSIKQASSVLRLKEEVLVAFEEGDFDSIPKSGYAQGMLSSYARYLGLNAKTVVNQFSTDLFENERGAGSHEARRRSRHTRDADDGPLYETPQAAAVSQSHPQRMYVESRGFLPTSGGFAGDLGDFATTSDPRPRYASDSHRDAREEDYPQGRPYTSRAPLSSGTVSPLGQSQRQRPTTGRAGPSARQEMRGRTARYPSGSHPLRDEVTTRRVMPAQYRDDMRLDNEGGTYQAASTTSGRRSSRNIASTQRPNVQRRISRGSREQLRDRERAQTPSRGGLLGMVELFFQDRSRVILLIVLVLCLVITATLIFSIGSCVSAQQSTGRSVAVASSSEEEKDDEKESMTSEEEERARAEAAAAKAAESDESVTERTIEVTIADGEVTWLEIEYDGTSDVAETVTGPWNRTYTVRQSISINVNDTTAVTVTEGGKKLEFDSKASGIGTITIQVAKKSDASTTTTTDAGSSDATSATNQQQSGEGAGAASSASSQTTTSYGSSNSGGATSGGGGYEGYTLDADGYYYGADGYYDANGTFYEYG